MNRSPSHFYSKIFFLQCESFFWCASHFVVDEKMMIVFVAMMLAVMVTIIIMVITITVQIVSLSVCL